MACRFEKNELNKPGKYYVDIECINCDACILIAPNHFALDEEQDIVFVKRQPVTNEEFALCNEAMEGCPVEAIGSDGDRDVDILGPDA